MTPNEILDLHQAIKKSILDEIGGPLEQVLHQFIQAQNILADKVAVLEEQLSDPVSIPSPRVVVCEEQADCADPANCCVKSPCEYAPGERTKSDHPNNIWAREQNLVGVYFQDNRWRAQKKVLGRHISLGMYDTAEEAATVIKGANLMLEQLQRIGFLKGK